MLVSVCRWDTASPAQASALTVPVKSLAVHATLRSRGEELMIRAKSRRELEA